MSLTERIQRVRQSKNDVEVVHGKQVLLTPSKPALTRLGPGTWDSAGCGTNYRKWPGDRIASRSPDGLRARLCGIW
jgi:hypothetical protein